ncbi:peptidase M15B and M15C DD-carboxypeptidase VanY/endolysin [Gloeomargarita lithophora Alchichica-D10]|uniref:Peptidase M15B and M15C DD-carboxypeptidase VanY/endolysin n=1 Tax=Gloeomargarita lithophora Alchichica-D10 TaxID=1188229 RepID=A0A1J0AGI5_9CYAN|nr:peptidase M15B and M15C DD-carboxypeptidase VanY/endolysin [Gloeomargarita lithophora Alchichica-D10]
MSPVDDIPEAQRQSPARPGVSNSSSLWRWLGIPILVMAGAGLWGFPRDSPPVTPVVSEPTPAPIVTPGDLLGHLPYSEASPQDLQAVTADGRVKLHRDAAQAFLAMQKAARAEGVILVPLSGFRTRQDQQTLFYDVKAERLQQVTERAQVSAPPGYSEHHTGYALDMGDGKKPATHIEITFEQTAAFAWLKKRAAQFHFELSFPPNNAQGISYEPWHWRFVGTPASLELFYQAKNRS